MTLTVVAEPVSAETPTVQVSVGSSPSITNLLTVWRTHADGTRHQVLTESASALVGSWVGFDYHAPFNQPVTYSAESSGLVSAPSSAVVVLSTVPWLIHPSDPSLSVPVKKRVMAIDSESSDARVKRFDILGAAEPVHVRSAPRSTVAGKLTVNCEGPQELAALEALLADGGPLLMNTPWLMDLGWMWVQPLQTSKSNLTSMVKYSRRRIEITYEQTRQPESDVRVQTYDERRAKLPGTYTAHASLHTSYNNRTLDVRVP